MPAARATWPLFPAPLDDVYIYFDFARATARGCVLCWTEDTGYSSGATSPLYALVLSVGYLAGARGALLGWFAGAIALASLFDLARSLCRIAGPKVWVAAAMAALPLSVPLLDWTLVSGMEVAFVAALLGRAVHAVDAAAQAPPHVRDRAQLGAGIWLAALALGRPECAPLAAALGVAIGHAAGSRPLAASLARALLPPLLALAALSALNLVFTGEVAANGALRKGITHDPHAAPSDVAVLVTTNALRLYTAGVEIALGGAWGVRALVLLAVGSVLSRRTRRLGVALLAGALGAFFVVTLNKTAPFQNLRYVAPTLLMLLVAAALGLYAAAQRGGPARVIAFGLAAVSMGSAARELPIQRRHYVLSARNIREQQVEVGLRLAALDPPARRVFVGDAGAIPYVSGLPALDGLGLGGYRGLPFARASVEGVGAVVELVERLSPEERPDVLAIYDGWWPGLGEHFGRRELSVRIEDNVICADPEKVVYRADWSLLEDRAALEAGARFRLDVADLLDERRFQVEIPGPRAGYVSATALLDERGARRYDAQRLLAEGQALSFVVPEGAYAEGTRLVLVTDSPAGTALSIERAGGERHDAVVTTEPGRWSRVGVPVDLLIAGERVRVVATRGALRLGSIEAKDAD